MMRSTRTRRGRLPRSPRLFAVDRRNEQSRLVRMGARGASYDVASRRGRNDGFGPDDGFEGVARPLFVVLAALVAVVALRLVWLQVIQGPSLAASAAAQRTNVVAVHARRGTIYDRDGNVLAMSQACKTIYCNPQKVNDPNGAARILAEKLGGEASSYLATLRGDSSFSYVRRQVDTDKAKEVEDSLRDAKANGIYFLDDVKRVYPYGAVGSQVLGIVGTDGDGLSGLELYYDDVLKGTDGELVFETGSKGTPIAGTSAQASTAQDGTDIVISLDIDVQEAAERTIAKGTEDFDAESGSVMVTDPKTGQIIAACSTPLYDVTDTSKIEEGATSLKPVSSSFEPGSIFKLLTTAIGIDDGLMGTETTYDVPAYLKVGDDYVSDDDGRDYGMDMSVREILRRSSNAGAALLAQNVIGAERFSEGIARFGIGSYTGIDFPGEVPGLVKTLDQYDGASLGSMSFGQSLAVPLVQMVKAVGALADGGTLHAPHFLVSKGGQEAEWGPAGQAVSAETASAVTDMMRTVVQEGTAVHAQVEGYDVAGKTGTGEQAGETGGYIDYSYVSSLIGFAPASDAKVLVYVGLNGTPYLASASAAPLFSTIMGEALSDLGVAPTN